MGRSWQTLRELTQQVAPVVGQERDGNVTRISGAEKKKITAGKLRNTSKSTLYSDKHE